MSNAATIVDSYPLSPMQQGMLYHALAEPHSGIDIEQLVITFREPVDAGLLRFAWERVVARHAVLRSCFQVTDAGPKQVVFSSVAVPFETEDWSGEAENTREERLAAWLQEDRTLGFAMDRAPLLRFRLFQYGPQHFRLVWTFHHALLDGRSFPILLDEAAHFYRVPDGAKPPLPRPYRDFIWWLQAQDQSSAEAFWRKQLEGFSTPTALPVQGLPGCTVTRQQGEEELRLSGEATSGLRSAAEREGVTLNTLVQAAWAILLSRYSSEEDVCFGATRAGRRGSIDGADEMVGLFINTVPVRARVPDAMPVAELLQQLRDFWLEVRPHEHTPLARVQSWSRLAGGQPLFQTLVVFENSDLATRYAGAEGWANREVRLHEQTSFPLCLAAYGGEQLRLVAEYDRSRFDPATIQRLLGHLQTILASLTAPGATIGEVVMLPEPERAALLGMWEYSNGNVAPAKTLHALFEEQVARAPHAIAVAQDTVRLTYAELNERAEVVATHLIAAGAGPETIVGLCLERTPELVVGLLGILKANAAYLPIDLAYPPERLAFMLEDAKAPILLTQRHLAKQLPTLAGTNILAIDEMTRRAPYAHPSPGTPEQLCYVIYTSGSTGMPKGCCITHRNITRLFAGTEEWFGFNAADVWTLFHSTAFDFSVWEIWGALLHGSTLVVVPFTASRSPELFRQLLARERVTVLNQTPSAFRQLIAADAEQKTPLALRYVIFGGEALEMQSLEPWFARHGDTVPQLVNMYGITETTVHVTYRPLRASDTQGGSVIGVPIPDLRLHIVDAKLRLVPIGVPGELYVGGGGVARGYLQRPELTAERFLPNPFHPGERLYRTGDSARLLPGGDVEYLGRVDQQVKIRGFRVELGEIESVLLKHPAIQEAAVLARADAAGGKRLVAWLVAKGGAPSPAELRQHLKAFLPDYMIPAQYVPVEQMPLTNNGKLDVRALPEPSAHRPELAAGHVAPRTTAERVLAGIWSQVLKVEKIGVHDNFFELGGDSILSILAVTEARRAGIEISPKQLFDHPTISALASMGAPTRQRLPDLPADGDVPLTPIQHWFFAREFNDPHHWNQSFTFLVKGEISRSTMASALDQVLAAHPVFRLRFERNEEGWRQRFGPPLEPMKSLPPSAHDLQASLRLEGPLARFAFDGQRLTAAIHHLIVDGVSWRVFAQDLDAALRGVPALKATTGFHTWSRAIQSAAGAPKLDEEIPYWTELLAQPSSPLPLDRPAAANLESSTETITTALSAQETTALQQALSTQGAQLREALLAALGQALTSWTGGNAVTIEMEGHGREEALLAELTGAAGTADLSHTIGWFTTIYPARLERGATVAQIRAMLGELPRRGFGYSLLRSRGAVPSAPAEVLFNYLGHFGQLTDELEQLQLENFTTAGWHAPRAARAHLLEINTLLRDGRLEVQWNFSRALHDRGTIERVAGQFLDVLRSLATADGSAALPRLHPAITSKYPTAEDAYPLSAMQRLFYTLECAKPGSGNDQWHCRLRGDLDVQRFQHAWSEVIRRHPALRSAYIADPDPLAVVLREAKPTWTITDLSHLPRAEQERRVAAFLAQDGDAPFDLAQPPLTRLALFIAQPHEHRFVWTHHHLEIDGWSWPIIFREIAAFYEGKTLEAAKPYGAFIRWLSQRPSGESFWREQLRAFRVPTPLPLRGASEPAGSEATATILSPLTTFAQRAGVTVNAVCQAAWAVLLAQRSGLREVAFGAAVSGRPADLDGAASIVGHFVNNLPIRARVDYSQSFSALCQQMHRQLAAITEHQHAAISDIQDWSELPWNARLFSTLLVFQNYAAPEKEWQFGNVRVEELHAPVRSNYPLTVVFQPGEELTVSLIAQPQVTTGAELTALTRAFSTLFENACQWPQKSVGELAQLLPALDLVSSGPSAGALPQDAFANSSERLIAEIWQEALGRKVSATDNFFDLGGHSLLMLQVHRRLCAKLQRELPVVTLFRFSTIRSLAAHLSGAPAAAPVLSPAQARAAKARAAMARQAMKAWVR